MHDHAAAHTRTTLRLLTVTGALVGLVVGLILLALTGSLLVGVVVFVVVGVAAGLGTAAAAAPVVRSAVGVTPLAAPPARLINKLEGLSAVAGVEIPALATAALDGPHALIVGERGGGATLAVTPELVERLDRVELEAVLARQLGLSRDRSARLHTVAAVTLGLPALSADLGGAASAGSLARAVAALTVPLRPLSGWSHRALGRLQGSDGAFEADRAATLVTRYPPALADALEKLAAGPAPPPIAALAVLFSDAGAGGEDRLADRIDALREL